MFVDNLGHQFCCHFFQGVPCLFNEVVMEVMWALQNLMHFLVPEEKMELRNEDRVPMSQGLKILLNRYGFDVKPEMVSSQVDFLNIDIKCFMLYASLSFSVTLQYVIVCAMCTWNNCPFPKL
jgi:hypothetical protein